MFLGYWKVLEIFPNKRMGILAVGCVIVGVETVLVVDNSIFYFVVMIRHGAHVIFTQMVSTHEAMVRGSLDFPNLISLSDVTQNFVVDVEVYGMVSRAFFTVLTSPGKSRKVFD